MLNKLPIDHELHIGRHKNGVGFYAEITACKGVYPTIWEGVSHGHTSEEAISNALCRFHDQPETLYQSGDFNL